MMRDGQQQQKENSRVTLTRCLFRTLINPRAQLVILTPPPLLPLHQVRRFCNRISVEQKKVSGWVSLWLRKMTKKYGRRRIVCYSETFNVVVKVSNCFEMSFGRHHRTEPSTCHRLSLVSSSGVQR